MKFVLSILFLLCANICLSQTSLSEFINKENNKIEFEKILDKPNETAQQLYTKTIEWITGPFNVNDNIEILSKDLNAGLMVCKVYGLVNTSKHSLNGFTSLVKIYIKDEKIRCLITDIIVFGDRINFSNKPIENIMINESIAKRNKQAFTTSILTVKDMWLNSFEANLNLKPKNW